MWIEWLGGSSRMVMIAAERGSLRSVGTEFVRQKLLAV